MKRLILYDLDGTLVDTLEDIAYAANRMLETLQQPVVPAHDIRRYVGRGVRELVGRCLGSSDSRQIDEAVRIYRDLYRAHMLDHSRLYPHALEVLEYFKDRRQAVITNKPNPYSRDLLTALGVAGYFFEIIGGDSPHPRKPDPASTLALMEQAGAGRDETLFIGDSPVDIDTGRRAGILTVIVGHGLSDGVELRQAGPDMLVQDFSELLMVARRETW